MSADTRGTYKVAVIGGGLGGLAAAATLAARGYRPVVFDRNGWFGGKAAVLEEEDFRFDMGPTILTAPTVLERIFGEAGRDMADYLKLVRLDPQWRCFFEDGGVLDLAENVDAMKKNLAVFSPSTRSAQGYEDFIKLSERLHEVSDTLFAWKSVETIRDTMTLKQQLDPKTLSEVLALRLGSTVAETDRRVAPDERVAQMLDQFARHAGSSPYNAPARLCASGHVQTELGVWHPMGGVRAVPAALKKLAEELGAEFRADTKVTKIVRAGDRVVGVETETGEQVACSAVVSNMDAVRTYRELVGGAVAEKYANEKRYEPSCSAVVFYLGLSQRYEHLAHHDFVFSRNVEEEVDAIYEKGEPAPDPTLYLAAPSATEPCVAPEGGEALYVMAHTPYLRPHHDWSAMMPGYRRTIFDKLARTAGLKDLEDRIVFEKVLTPQDMQERYNVLNGAIYGLASHGRFFGAFKPGNRSRDVDGLYLCGGGAHPGPGMPMAMMSGWIAADALDQDFATVRAA